MSFSSSSPIAQRIWEKDNTVYENFDHIVEWIGDGKPSSNAILKSYMNHFDFKDLALEQAFRTLCSHLSLKGESQQIDRVLSEFAGRYFECNPTCIFGSTDVVHAIVYSLLLLNTDLHVVQGDYKRMTRSEFINNTMSTIQVQPTTPALGDDAMLCDDHRSSGVSFQSLDWIPLQRHSSNVSGVSSRSCAPSLDAHSAKSWQHEIRTALKHMYNSIRQSQITHLSSPPASLHTKRTSFRLFHKRDALSASPQPSSSHLQADFPATSPYYKEGIVVRKHLLEKSDQKAKHRDWKECFMVVERSQLCMYKFDASHQKRVCKGVVSHALLMSAVDLKHTLANALPSGYSRQRPHAFALEQASGGVHLFQVGSAEQVQEWVSTCNYWAARESKEPLAGGVSSMEYGWGHCLPTVVHEWQAPSPPTTSSQWDEVHQLKVLRKHVHELSDELDHHRDLKPQMEAKFGPSKIGAKAMTNWEKKSGYLLREIIKYQNYCDSIEKSLVLKNKIMST